MAVYGLNKNDNNSKSFSKMNKLVMRACMCLFALLIFLGQCALSEFIQTWFEFLNKYIFFIYSWLVSAITQAKTQWEDMEFGDAFVGHKSKCPQSCICLVVGSRLIIGDELSLRF